jgi:hypothetical protein
MSSPVIYCLRRPPPFRHTYVGETINLKHRLRQHNREIKV